MQTLIDQAERENQLLEEVAKQLCNPQRSPEHLWEFVSTDRLTPDLTLELGGLLYCLLSTSKDRLSLQGTILHTQWLKNIGAHLARSYALENAWPQFAPLPLLIKGADLELTLYQDWGLSIGARSSSDWDLIIPSSYFHEVARDWESRYGQPVYPQSARLPHEPPHEMGFYIDQLLFELHIDPAPRFACELSGTALWERGIPTYHSSSVLVRHPTPSDRLLIWLTQYTKGGSITRLTDWLDLSLILCSLEKRLPELPVISSRYGLQLAFQDALCRWSSSPLSSLSPLSQDWISQRYPLESSKLLFTNRLTHQTPPHLIHCAQVRLTPPRLRASYLGRALIRVLSSSTQPRQTSSGEDL